MPLTTLYLVRHGEADDDEAVDPSLTPLGLRQAALAGEALQNVGARAVLHSSRRRAVETARLIASSLHDAPAQHSELLEDRTPIPDDWSSVPNDYHSYLRSVPPDEADQGAQLLTRSLDELSRIDTSDRTVVAVTHNFVIGWIVREVLDAPWWRWIGLNQANGAITVVRWSDARAPELLSFNERGHLRAMGNLEPCSTSTGD